MNKTDLKAAIARYHPLYKIHGHRLLRLIRSPLHTGTFYLRNIIAKIHPYRVTKMMPWGSPLSFYLPEANQIYYYDFWELGLANLVIDILKEGDTFIDVGSHVGYYSSLAASLVGPNGRVLACEPTPRTFKSVQQNLSSFTTATAHNGALSNKKGTLSFFDYGPKHSAFNSFSDRTDPSLDHIHGDAHKLVVQTDTLDNILEQYSLTPTFVKIDAEGAESLILSGATRTLSSARPIFSFEVGGDAEWDESTQDALMFFRDANYALFNISDTGRLSHHTLKDKYTYDNIVCIPAEKVSQYSHTISR